MQENVAKRGVFKYDSHLKWRFWEGGGGQVLGEGKLHHWSQIWRIKKRRDPEPTQ